MADGRDTLPAIPATTLGTPVQVELVGPHLQVSGTFDLGRFRRLSDYLNHQPGLLELSNATVLRRNGDPTRVTTRHIWVNTADVTVIGQLGEVQQPLAPEFRIQKSAMGMIFVTPGHTMTGELYVPSGGDIEYIDEGTLRSAFDGRREMI